MYNIYWKNWIYVFNNKIYCSISFFNNGFPRSYDRIMISTKFGVLNLAFRFFPRIDYVEWPIVNEELPASTCLHAVEWFSSYANFPVSAGTFNGSRRYVDYRRKFTGWHNFRAARCAQKAVLILASIAHPFLRILRKICESLIAETRES